MYEFSRQEIIEDILEYLENTSGFHGCDLHNAVFNNDYYIIGTAKAKKALESYGVFNAMDRIVTYETDNYGELYTSLLEPEQVANMIYYIESEEYLSSLDNEIREILDDYWNDEVPEKDTKKLIELFKKELQNEL